MSRNQTPSKKSRAAAGKAGKAPELDRFGPSAERCVDFVALRLRIHTRIGWKPTRNEMNETCLGHPGKDLIMDSKDQAAWMKFTGEVETTLIKKAEEKRAEKAEKARFRKEFYESFIAWCKDREGSGVGQNARALIGTSPSVTEATTEVQMKSSC